MKMLKKVVVQLSLEQLEFFVREAVVKQFSPDNSSNIEVDFLHDSGRDFEFDISARVSWEDPDEQA